ncbi:hypothetical protein EDB83DRAFT_2518218 [Lactarius deliciosus]|nr:hypothetical protein EDB83DRAFT_2518218 [Lactarius deliciosus]
MSGVSKGGDGRRLRDALGYVMRLDELAAHEGNGGARWFSEVHVLAKELAKFIQAEAAFLAQVTRSSSVPLDVLLLRGHALSLPYLHSPTLCFLVYLSPRAYLSLQRSAPATTSPQTRPPTSDFPSTHLYNCLSGDHPPIGRFHILRPPLIHCYLVALRFRSPLNAIGFSYDFPLPTGPDAGKYGWVLGFGAGIVISQSSMLEIARAVQPQELSYAGTEPSLSFMTGSWVDMLLNSEGALSSERYTATYVSPTNMHPPLRLTLTAPDEPGFLLERVQVYNMLEAWAVLEIVREQYWLNEVLNGIAWMPELVVGPPVGNNPDAEATEEELRVLLSGTYTPLSIPVNVYVAPTAVVLTFPERPLMLGMVSISVLLNGPAGAMVELQGAMGADVQMATLEEANQAAVISDLQNHVFVLKNSGFVTYGVTGSYDDRVTGAILGRSFEVRMTSAPSPRKFVNQGLCRCVISGNNLELLPAGQHCISHPNIMLRRLYTVGLRTLLRVQMYPQPSSRELDVVPQAGARGTIQARRARIVTPFDYSSMVKQHPIGGDSVENSESSSEFLDVLRTHATDELHTAALEYGTIPQGLSAIHSTMDKLTKCALEAKVSATNVDHENSNEVKQEEGVLCRPHQSPRLHGRGRRRRILDRRSSQGRRGAHATEFAVEAVAIRIKARADAEVADDFAQETSRRRQEIQRIPAFGHKVVFVPTEVMDVASQVLSGMVAGVGVDLRT